MSETFLPAWWLSNRHLQSCVTTLLPYRAKTALTWEQFELPDGDFMDLSWCGNPQAPLMILLHGLEGSVYSPYIQMMLDVLGQRWRIVVMHFRTCSGRLNRLSRSYHAADYEDLAYLVRSLRARHPEKKMVGVGFSLGGNVLLHYLARVPTATLECAVAVSIPFDLKICVDSLPRFYQWLLLRTLKQKTVEKIKLGYDMPVTMKELQGLNNFTVFDNAVTAPLHGFLDAKDYYERGSIRSTLCDLQHPTLIIHANDDPLIPMSCIPQIKELSSQVVLDLHSKGGHVGFIESISPTKRSGWLIKKIRNFLDPFVHGLNPDYQSGN